MVILCPAPGLCLLNACSNIISYCVACAEVRFFARSKSGAMRNDQQVDKCSIRGQYSILWIICISMSCNFVCNKKLCILIRTPYPVILYPNQIILFVAGSWTPRCMLCRHSQQSVPLSSTISNVAKSRSSQTSRLVGQRFSSVSRSVQYQGQ